MQQTIKGILDVVTAARVAGQPLDYVAQVTLGGVEIAHLIFPFVNIGPIKYRNEALTIGPGSTDTARAASDVEIITVIVQCGVKIRDGQTAFYGAPNASPPVKGILNLCDDLKTLLRGQWFGGAFNIQPAEIKEVMPYYIEGEGDHMWIGEIEIEGRRRIKRLRPQSPTT